jgi:molybdopterin molybdotransferase
VDNELPVYISVAEAEEAIAGEVAPLPMEECVVEEALGRVLAEDITATDQIPPFDNSAMDGFAVRSCDVTHSGTVLKVIEDIPAGSWPAQSVHMGECARIMTGAPVPPGTDAVVPVEDTETAGKDEVLILSVPQTGQHVRYKGEHIQPGRRILRRGDPVTPSAIGMLATLGVTSVRIFGAPTVAVIATGDELVEPSEEMYLGSIRNSNGPALSAQAAALGCNVLQPRVARDDLDDTRARLQEVLSADVIVLSGGVSVGEYDHVKEAMSSIGIELLFWKVRQKPGKPLVFGLAGKSLVFGLPGNPVSSAVCFERYVRPAIRGLMGYHAIQRERVPAILVEPVKKRSGLYYFARGKMSYDKEGRVIAWPTGPQGSNLYASVVLAECLIHLPEHLENPGKGTRVEIETVDW